MGRPASQGRNEVVGGGRGSIGNLQMKAGNVDALLKTTRRRGKQREAQPVINLGASSMETIPAMMWDSLRGWVQRPEGHGIVEVMVTVMWDVTVEEHWWRVLKYMDLVGKNGIVLNPAKFQFCS